MYMLDLVSLISQSHITVCHLPALTQDRLGECGKWHCLEQQAGWVYDVLDGVTESR